MARKPEAHPGLLSSPTSHDDESCLLCAVVFPITKKYFKRTEIFQTNDKNSQTILFDNPGDSCVSEEIIEKIKNNPSRHKQLLLLRNSTAYVSECVGERQITCVCVVQTQKMKREERKEATAGKVQLKDEKKKKWRGEEVGGQGQEKIKGF